MKLLYTISMSIINLFAMIMILIQLIGWFFNNSTLFSQEDFIIAFTILVFSIVTLWFALKYKKICKQVDQSPLRGTINNFLVYATLVIGIAVIVFMTQVFVGESLNDFIEDPPRLTFMTMTVLYGTVQILVTIRIIRKGWAR